MELDPQAMTVIGYLLLGGIAGVVVISTVLYLHGRRNQGRSSSEH